MTAVEGHGQKLSRKAELAVAALLCEPTVSAAAAKAGVSESSLLRWLQNPDFRDLYRNARREAVAQAISQLQRAASVAVETLVELMQDPEVKCSSRVMAAKTVLEMAIKGIELEDLDVRLTVLERSREVIQ